MRKIKDLSNAEADAYLNDMTEIQCDVSDEIVSLADKYGISRDEVMKHFSTVMVAAAKFVSFKDYKLDKEEADENLG